MPEAYCAGFLTAWNKALQLCRSVTYGAALFVSHGVPAGELDWSAAV